MTRYIYAIEGRLWEVEEERPCDEALESVSSEEAPTHEPHYWQRPGLYDIATFCSGNYRRDAPAVWSKLMYS